MDRILLYLQGMLMESVEICLPAFDPELSFQENVEIRKAYVDHKIETLKIMRTRQILKVKWDYYFAVHLASRVNYMEFTDEEIKSLDYEPDKYSKGRSRSGRSKKGH